MKTLEKKSSQNKITHSFSKEKKHNRNANSARDLYSSIERKIKKIQLIPEDPGNSFSQSIETLLIKHKINENPTSEKDIIYHNELFRELLKELNTILDIKLEKRNNHLKTESFTKDHNININSLNKEYENNISTIERQNKEISKFEARVLQVQNEDYSKNLYSEISETKEKIDKLKKQKRSELDHTFLNGKVLEDIVEIKGLPENLKKSFIIDSDLMIFNMKNKNLKKKLEKLNEELEATIMKTKKIDEEFDMTLKKASDLRISLENNSYKSKYDELNTKIYRFQKCIGGIKSTNKKMVQKTEIDLNDLKLKLKEKDVEINEKNRILNEIRLKLSQLTENEKIDQNLKGILHLFTNSNKNNSEISTPSLNAAKSQMSNNLNDIEEQLSEKNIELKKNSFEQDKNKLEENLITKISYENTNNIEEKNDVNDLNIKKEENSEEKLPIQTEKFQKITLENKIEEKNKKYKGNLDKVLEKSEKKNTNKILKQDENKQEIIIKISEKTEEKPIIEKNKENDVSIKPKKINKKLVKQIKEQGQEILNKNEKEIEKEAKMHINQTIDKGVKQDNQDNKKPKVIQINSKTINKKLVKRIKEEGNKILNKQENEKEFTNTINEVKKIDEKELHTINNDKDIPSSKSLNSKPKKLKKLNDEGSGTLIISPQNFRSVNEDNSKMMFCRVKIGNKAYNTKISGEKEHKPSWDENIEIRKPEEENRVLIQIWNFDTKQSEQFIGETNIELDSKEINIYTKKQLINTFIVNNNGIKKGELIMEIKWIDNEEQKIKSKNNRNSIN